MEEQKSSHHRQLFITALHSHQMRRYVSFATLLHCPTPAFARRPQNRTLRARHCFASSSATMAARLRSVVLIDMDNTLVNFDAEFGKRWAQHRPSDGASAVLNRKHFELEQNFSDELRPLAEKIMSQPGFFIAFEPMPGALQAVREMIDDGLTVYFCTAPLPLQYETCVSEKFAWVRKHLGDQYLSKIIITRDKTVVKGAVLIDDKPKVTGACGKPEWTHVVFEQSYNLHVEDAPRMRQWSQWRQVVEPILSQMS